MIPKPKFCENCPITHLTSQNAGEGYVPLKLVEGSTLVVGEAAGEDEAKHGEGFCGGAGQWLRSMCRNAKIDFTRVSLLNVIGCRPPENVFPGDAKWRWTDKETARQAVEYCKENHLWPQLRKAAKKKIIALGGHSLEALTERRGITLWRGSPLALRGEPNVLKVLPTLHPAYLMRQSKLASVAVADLRKTLTVPPEHYNLWPTLEEVEAYKPREFAFDFEWDRDGNITLCGVTDKFYGAMVVPFYGAYIPILQRLFENATGLIGHNIIQADMAQFEKLGWKLREDCEIHDTMLKQHLVQPDYKHDLGFVASVFTNKVFWKGKGWEEEDEEGNIIPSGQQWRTWDRPNAIPRELGGYGGCQTAEEAFRLYNARDTDGEFQINVPLSQKLRQYELERVYKYVSVPIAFICRDMGTAGFRIDTSKLGEVRADIDAEIQQLEESLPDGLRPYEEEVGCNEPAPPGSYRAKIKICKGSRKQAHAPIELTFTKPGEKITCPTCGKVVEAGKLAEAKIIKSTRLERVVPYNSAPKLQAYAQGLKLKEIRDLKTGNITTGKRARKSWGSADHPEFWTLDKLKKQVTLRNNFAKDELLGQERMYFDLKVHGTSEGRLASTGHRKGIDLNIQNQPKEFRKIYVPDEPGWAILDLDIVQGENMLTAWLAKDWDRWERLNTPGYDEHCDLASKIFNRVVTKSAEDKFYRDIGKKKNHAKNYGMGVKKERDYLASEGYNFTEKEIREQNEIWAKLNKRTAEWQRETIATSQKQGFLVNPFGRRRWFSSRDSGGQALAFLPASTLADMILRMMIAHYPNDPRCREAIYQLKIGVFAPLVERWRSTAQVHDSLVLQGPGESWKEQASRSVEIFSQPWAELDGFKFGVEVKMSTERWGDCKVVEV